MSNHDYTIANAVGATVRADINSALAAIASQNSSATEPATMYAYQLWFDTSVGYMKQRNSTNTAWVGLSVGTPTASTHAVPAGLLSVDLTNFPIYSEGAWTPVNTNADGAAITLTLVSCKFVLIGKLLICTGRITPSGTSANQAQFSLPYSVYTGSFAASSNYATAVQPYMNGSNGIIYGVGQTALSWTTLAGKEIDVAIVGIIV